jgi:hypothetical protein
MRDARRRRIRDFIALFNVLWYRDFPLTRGYEDDTSRAMWTTHIASVVKQCADLLGLQTRYETGGRTDAIIQFPGNGEIWAHLEWEWQQADLPKINEFSKLSECSNKSQVCYFIGYSQSQNLPKTLERINEDWKQIEKPLICFLIVYKWGKKRRRFREFQTYEFKAGKKRLLRKQPALPWDVKHSRWAVASNVAELN